MTEEPTPERFRQVFDLLESHIEKRYGIPVVLADVADPFTGDLDGAEIKVDWENEPEDALFILVHLFGHTVQWNVDPAARELGSAVEANPTAEKIDALEKYEVEAARYSLQLLHEAGVHDLDGWLADFSSCDFAYLKNFYQKGEKLDFRSFWIKGTQPLEPLPIPPFRPERWKARWDGIVI
jgi:hypothetical protein